MEPRNDDRGQDASWDDGVHRILGEATARLLSTGPLFRDGDVIGLGSGRGVYYTVDALTRLPALRVSDVTLVSLTPPTSFGRQSCP